jgi:hypothetical protein
LPGFHAFHAARLDTANPVESISFMKAGVTLVVLLAGIGMSLAQEAPVDSGDEQDKTPMLRFNGAVPFGPERVDNSAEQTVSTKTLQFSGPLVRPLKGRTFGQALKGFFHLLNPFARSEETDQIKRYEGFSSRPWADTVGWVPGASAFPDPTTHSPSIALVSVAPR